MNNSTLHIPLNTTPDQVRRLQALQQAFAEVCNALGPVVRDSRCWNRVTLHHLTYRSLRERFPQVGSQMVCNAIYSVSRTCRVIFQTPASPFNIQRMTGKTLPVLQFLPSAPVYFDRHTLSISNGVMSMFTMDGRMRFELNLSETDQNRFNECKLQEIVLRSAGEQFTLSFSFSSDNKTEAEQPLDAESPWPQYVVVRPDESDVPVNFELANGLNASSADSFGVSP
jgi:hypothetical protein